ncbi:hypothetical protein [Microlunatus speluncae]|uniref:hypothetical protein n=1 Tax=Microlunatus speluncae TaxID=2594267 RepID=UPI00126675F3|nr:hypothetical protein [Microlunatus speluncae]
MGWYGDAGRLEVDLRDHARAASGSYAGLVDLAAIRCAAPTLRLIRVLYGIERSTIERMRALLVTPTHSDAQVTAFLCTWAYERHWIAAALREVLDRHGWPVDFPADAEPPLRRFAGEVRHRLLPITEALWTNFVGDPVVAVHLVEGVLDEALTRAAYRRLTGLEPTLSALAEPVLATKINHGHYLRTRAVVDLAGSATARRLVRRRLRRQVWPPPGPELPAAEVGWFVRTVFAEPADRREADAEIGALPGLAGLRTGVTRSRIRVRTVQDSGS